MRSMKFGTKINIPRIEWIATDGREFNHICGELTFVAAARQRQRRRRPFKTPICCSMQKSARV
jgi:hypothetical protein